MRLPNFRRFSVASQLSLFAAIILLFGVFVAVNSTQRQQETRTRASVDVAYAIPALVQKNFGVFQNSASSAVSFTANVQAGNLLIVGVTQYKGAVLSVTDNKGNSYTLLGNRYAQSAGTEYVQLYYAKNAIAGSTTVTVKFAEVVDNTVGVYEYSGIDRVSPVDKVVSQVGYGVSPNGGVLTGAQNNELYFVLGTDDWANNSAPSAGSGYALLNHQDEALSHERYYSEYRVSPQGSYQTNFSIGASSYWAVIGVAFKPAPMPTSTPIPTNTPAPTLTLTPTPKATATPVPPTSTPIISQTVCNGLVVSSALALDKTSVTFGDTISGKITYSNPCTVPVSVKSVMIGGMTYAQTEFGFSNATGALTVQPGQMVSVEGSRKIVVGDPVGLWNAFGRYQDAAGVWHDNGAKVNFNVVNAITSAPTQVVPTAPITVPPTSTYLGFTLLLDGIGSTGDRSNPDGTGNPDPVRKARVASVEFFNDQNQLVLSKTVTVNFDSNKGAFTSVEDFGAGLPSGLYIIKLKIDQYLKVVVPGIQTLTVGKVNTLPTTSLIAGDINGDNQINILDFNLLMGCYSDLLPAVSCDAQKKALSDITDDGAVNQYDYNLFLRELNNRGGD